VGGVVAVGMLRVSEGVVADVDGAEDMAAVEGVSKAQGDDGIRHAQRPSTAPRSCAVTTTPSLVTPPSSRGILSDIKTSKM
jgi:hypothetical protein